MLLPLVSGSVLLLVDVAEGGGAILPLGGGGSSPKPPELCGRDFSLFLPCWIKEMRDINKQYSADKAPPFQRLSLSLILRITLLLSIQYSQQSVTESSCIISYVMFVR